IARRPVGRDTLRRFAKEISFSRRAPGGNAPSRIPSSKRWATWKYRGMGPLRSKSLKRSAGQTGALDVMRIPSLLVYQSLVDTLGQLNNITQCGVCPVRFDGKNGQDSLLSCCILRLYRFDLITRG